MSADTHTTKKNRTGDSKLSSIKENKEEEKIPLIDDIKESTPDNEKIIRHEDFTKHLILDPQSKARKKESDNYFMYVKDEKDNLIPIPIAKNMAIKYNIQMYDKVGENEYIPLGKAKRPISRIQFHQRPIGLPTSKSEILTVPEGEELVVYLVQKF